MARRRIDPSADAFMRHRYRVPRLEAGDIEPTWNNSALEAHSRGGAPHRGDCEQARRLAAVLHDELMELEQLARSSAPDSSRTTPVIVGSDVQCQINEVRAMLRALSDRFSEQARPGGDAHANSDE